MASNKVNQIIRAWKDESFRRSLSDAELAQLPAHPAGLIELTGLIEITDQELETVIGAGGSRWRACY